MTTAIITPASATTGLLRSLQVRVNVAVPIRATAMVMAAVAALLPVVDSLPSSKPAVRVRAPAAPEAPPGPAEALSRVGPRFEANDGQFDPAVRFVSRASGYSLFLTANEAVMAVGGTNQGGADAFDVVRMRLVGAKADPKMTGGRALTGMSNYVNGNDPTRWVTGVRSYAEVRYHDVYQGIDLVYRGDDEARLEYDFVIAPGAEPASIAMEYSGAEDLRLEPGGGLVIATEAGDLRHNRPFLYQDIAGERRQVTGHFVVDGSEVSFEVGAYDRAAPLVIDPVVGFSTYLGGNANDQATGIAVDRLGFAYVVGTTNSTAFPTTEGVDRTCGSNCEPLSDGFLVPRVAGLPTGNSLQRDSVPRTPQSTPRPDAFVTKLAPDGGVVYSTYLGGNGADEGLAVAVDDSGRAYIAGRTDSPDFPTTANALDRTCGTAVDTNGNGTCDFRLTDDPLDHPLYGQTKADAFVTKLDHTGGLDVTKRAYSTFFGGSGDDTQAGYLFFYPSVLNGFDPGDEIEHHPVRPEPWAGIASAGIAVVGETVYLTSSTASTDLIAAGNAPSSAPGYRPARVGPDSDCGTDGACNKWVTRCLPLCNMVQQFTDVFVAQLDTTSASSQALRYATYLGGTRDDVARGIAATTTESGKTRLYVVSTPEKEQCPRNGEGPACQPPCTLYGIEDGDGCKRPGVPQTALPANPPDPVPLDNLISILPDRSGADSLEWSAQIAGRALGVAVDNHGSPYVTGATAKKELATEGAFQHVHGGEHNTHGYIDSIEQYRTTDAFVANFDRDRPVLRYATYLGGNRDDAGRAIAVGDDGSVFVTGETNSFDNTRTLDADEAFPTKSPVQRKPECLAGETAPGGNCLGRDNSENVDAFVAGLDGTLENLVYSTYLGGTEPGPGFGPVANAPANDPQDTSAEGRRDVGRAIALGSGGASAPSVYVGGVSNSRDFPLVHAYRDSNTGLGEGFVTKLVPGGPAPQVWAVSPDDGSSAGGTEVVVRGAHFAGVRTVRFADQTCPSHNCTVSVVDDTTLTVTSPPLFDDSSDTTVDIVVSAPEGTSIRNLSSRFTYLDGGWEPAPTMSGTEKALTATVLDGPACLVSPSPPYCGKVLILRAGTKSVDLYDPKANEAPWSSVVCQRPMQPPFPAKTLCPRYPRSGHTATLLGDGTVLVAGGAERSAIAELYDPGEGTWTEAGALLTNRRYHAATLLTGSKCGANCGKVLVVGGQWIDSRTFQSVTNPAPHIPPQSSAELFDPTPRLEVKTPDPAPGPDPMSTPDVGHWSFAGSLRGDRYGGHTATLLTGSESECGVNCGRVLVVGGQASVGTTPSAQALVEIYDPLAPVPIAFATTVTNGELGVPEVSVRRMGHTAILLEGSGCEPHCGKVLLIGGGQLLVELYNPRARATEAFSAHSRLKMHRYFHSTVLLPGARVLVFGGTSHYGSDARGPEGSEIYDPRFDDGTGGWRRGSPVHGGSCSNDPRHRECSGPAVLLEGGRDVGEPRICGSNCGKVLVARGGAPGSAALYVPAPLPEAIGPSFGPADGGTPVSVTGHGFGGDMGVYFRTSKVCGVALAACAGVSYGTVAAISPPVSDRAMADVWVAREDAGIVRVPQSFEYIGPPGEVVPFVAVARSDDEINLSFRAAGSVLTANPPVSDYIIKQSRSPIDAANFDSAVSLCGGGVCRYEPTNVGQMLTLKVTGLTSGTHYYYAARARRSADQLGPIAFAAATTTGLPPVPDAAPRHAGGVVNQVRYHRGYSLVGLPAGTVVASQSPLYGWVDQGAVDARGRASTYFTQASNVPVAGGRGYWAWFSAPQAVHLPGPGERAVDLPLGGYRASMVGNPSGTAASTLSGHDYTARWDPALNGGAGGYHLSGYRQAQDLAVGEGIWAFSYEHTTLRLRAK